MKLKQREETGSHEIDTRQFQEPIINLCDLISSFAGRLTYQSISSYNLADERPGAPLTWAFVSLTGDIRYVLHYF